MNSPGTKLLRLVMQDKVYPECTELFREFDGDECPELARWCQRFRDEVDWFTYRKLNGQRKRRHPLRPHQVPITEQRLRYVLDKD